MGGPKKSPFAKAAKMSQAASSFNQKVDFHVAVASLKDNATALASTKHHFRSNEWWLSEEAIEAAAHKDAARQTPKGNGCGEREAEPDDEIVEFKDRADLQVEVHRNFATWSRMPPSHLSALLTCVEEVAFSKAALRSLRRTGQREPPMPVMLELLERECGVDPNSSIGPRRLLWELAEDLNKRADVQKRPCRMMTFPPCWSGKDACYKVFEKEKLIYMTCPGDVTVHLEWEDVADSKFTDLRVENNFSVQRAQVRSKSDPLVSPLCMLLQLKSMGRGAASQTLTKSPTPLSRSKSLSATDLMADISKDMGKQGVVKEPCRSSQDETMEAARRSPAKMSPSPENEGPLPPQTSTPPPKSTSATHECTTTMGSSEMEITPLKDEPPKESVICLTEADFKPKRQKTSSPTESAEYFFPRCTLDSGVRCWVTPHGDAGVRASRF